MRHVTAAVAACLAIFVMPAGRAAAEWPDKPVRVIVPYVAGGANDLLGRVFAEQLSKSLGQQFFVENRTGGGGLIGTEAVARSAPDGYTLIVSGMPSVRWRHSTAADLTTFRCCARMDHDWASAEAAAVSLS